MAETAPTPWRFIYAIADVLSVLTSTRRPLNPGRKCCSARTTVRSSNTFICDTASATDQRPFTYSPSLTAPHPFVEASVVTTTRCVTMPMGPDAARNPGVLQTARAFLHLEVTVILRCLSLVELSLKERYHL